MRRLSLLALALALAPAFGCSSPTEVSPLARAAVGIWRGEEIGMRIDPDAVHLSTPCIISRFPALNTDDDGRFDITGEIFASPTGFVNGLPTRIAGRIDGDSISLEYSFGRSDSTSGTPTVGVLRRSEDPDFIIRATCPGPIM